MKIFILEDNIFRQKWFRQNLVGHTVVMTDDVDEAKKLLLETVYDLICLDHDLGDDRKYTGLDVAKCMHKTVNKDTRIVIHSMNPVGSDDMYNVMVDNGCENVEKLMYFELQKRLE